MKSKKDLGENQEVKTKNDKDTSLKDFIFVSKNIIPDSICDEIIELISTQEWMQHSWTKSNTTETFSEKTKELSVLLGNAATQEILSTYIIQCLNTYVEKFSFPNKNTGDIVTNFSIIRFNKYEKGQLMRQHQDHIHSLFDGHAKGIPVLSIILNLNNDYSGAKLYFWDDYCFDLGKGDIVVFPSLFLFPHGVTECIDGVRYSAVCWAW